jgi:hypothetical protein
MPLFKKGNKDETPNYRPISVISCVGKETILISIHIFSKPIVFPSRTLHYLTINRHV